MQGMLEEGGNDCFHIWTEKAEAEFLCFCLDVY
jgi:hypothetical protein